jgi:hypothetical protein
LEIEPANVIWEVWKNMASEMVMSSAKAAFGGMNFGSIEDLWQWQLSTWQSLLDDPIWHASWVLDLQKKWLRAWALMTKRTTDPRSVGLAQRVAKAQG